MIIALALYQLKAAVACVISKAFCCLDSVIPIGVFMLSKTEKKLGKYLSKWQEDH